MKPARGGENGFTIIELIVVIAIFATVMAFVAPSVKEWQMNASYREAARMVANFLQEGRSRAISTGVAYSVSCEQNTPEPSCTVATVAYDETNHRFDEDAVVADYSFPTSVLMKTGSACDEAAIADSSEAQVEFYSNGSAELVVGSSPLTVCILTNSGSPRFKVTLESAATGKVSITRP